jgi:small subunit ribosomal protein S2
LADVGIKELLEAGVHFGHQTRRWDPSMRRYIHGERDGIHVIDLLQTEALLAEAQSFATELAGRGGKILFVGTKKQARDSIEEWAEKAGMPYVSRRWLGGLLTNFQTISKRINRLHELKELEDNGQLALLPTKERMAREAELAKLEFNLGGVRDMQRPPDAVVVVDLNNEEIAVAEATRLGIPIIALVDSNCNPRPIDYVIPGNDDAIRSCDLIIRTLGESILESASAWQAAEDARRQREEDERRKREEEERKRREEEAARKAAAEAEAAAKAAAASEGQAAQGQQAPQGQKPQPAAAPAKGKPAPVAQQTPPAPPEPAKGKPVPVAQQTAPAEAAPAAPAEPAAEPAAPEKTEEKS